MFPLQNRRILVTRPKSQSSALAALLVARGATAIQIPTIELAPPASYEALDHALAVLATYDYLLFTSANAVHAFVTRAHHLNLTLNPGRVAAIGPATARAVTEAGLPQPILPQAIYTAEGLSELLLPLAPGATMLLVRAAIARDHLPATLTAAGATLTLADAYQTIIPPASISALTTLFTTHPPDAITFSSASTAQNLATLLEAANLAIPPATVLASIGPVTSAAMRAAAMRPTLQARESTIAALVGALEEHFADLRRTDLPL